MKVEFSLYRFGSTRWSPPFPAIELNSPQPELKPYGRAKVAKIDRFPELEGSKGALLKWAHFEKKGRRWIVDIEKHEGYLEGGDVQIIMMIAGHDQDALYYARPMERGDNLWGPAELSPVTSKLLKLLSPAYYFEAPKG